MPTFTALSVSECRGGPVRILGTICNDSFLLVYFKYDINKENEEKMCSRKLLLSFFGP